MLCPRLLPKVLIPFKAMHRKLLFFTSKNISALAHLEILSLSFLHNGWIFPFPFCEVTCLIKSTSRSETEALCFTGEPIKATVWDALSQRQFEIKMTSCMQVGTIVFNIPLKCGALGHYTEALI